MDNDQFEKLMKAVEAGNAQLRSISLWATIIGGIALTGLLVGLVAWVAWVI